MAKVKIKKKKRKITRAPSPTKSQLLRAIKGSGGIVLNIAERGGWSRGMVYDYLKGDKWPEVREAFLQEREKVGDLAENTIQTVINQRLDLGEAARTARWYLERRCPDRGYKDKKELTLEGGKRPLHIQNETLIPLESLNLPLEVRKQILEAMEAQEEEGSSE